MAGAEKRQFGAQQVDGQNIGADGVVAYFGIGMPGDNLHAAQDVTMLRMAQEEIRNADLVRLATELVEQHRRITTRCQRLFIGRDRLQMALSQAWLEFLGGDIPCLGLTLGAVPVDLERPSIVTLKDAAQLGRGHAAVDAEPSALIRAHPAGQVVDQRAVRFHHQRYEKLLPLKAQRAFGPAIERIPRHWRIKRAASQMRVEPVKVCL